MPHEKINHVEPAEDSGETRAQFAERVLQLVETIKHTGGAVSIAGVKIAPCDERSMTDADHALERSLAQVPDGQIGAEVAQQLVVGWNKIGWVQVSVYPNGWKDTGEAAHIPVTPPEIDKLIRTLRRAKRQAYAKGERHTGFEDRPALPNGSELFT